ESLLFMWKGSVTVEVQGRAYELSPYDTLYIPCGAQYRISNFKSEIARVIQCSATADNAHPVHHSSFAEYSRREDRIRRLKGKDGFIMFYVNRPADKLVQWVSVF